MSGSGTDGAGDDRAGEVAGHEARLPGDAPVGGSSAAGSGPGDASPAAPATASAGVSFGTARSFRATVLIVLVVVAAMLAWQFLHRAWPFDPSDDGTIGPDPKPLTMYELQQRIAADVNKSVHTKWVLLLPPMGVGTVGMLIDDEGLPVSTACRPVTEPFASDPQFLPRHYVVDQGALLQLTRSAGESAAGQVDLGSAGRIELSFTDAKAHVLPTDDVEEMLRQPACLAAIRGRPLRVVVGFVEARRVLKVSGKLTDEASGQLQGIGFRFNPGAHSGGDELADEHAVPVFEYLGAIAAGSAPTVGRPALTPALAAGGSPSTASSFTIDLPGHIYLQRDAADNSGNDRRLVTRLANAGLPVIRTVDRIKPGGSPRLASIRYFNKEDQARAEQVTRMVRGFYADAPSPTRMNFVAPRGQIEVWLPRVSSAASGQ